VELYTAALVSGFRLIAAPAGTRLAKKEWLKVDVA
jgi:hypothetical protein